MKHSNLLVNTFLITSKNNLNSNQNMLLFITGSHWPLSFIRVSPNALAMKDMNYGLYIDRCQALCDKTRKKGLKQKT